MFSTFADAIANLFSAAQDWLFEHVAIHIVYALGLAAYTEQAFDAVEWFLIGVIEVTLLWVVLGACERFAPAQTIADRRAVLTDVFYTLLHRLGGFALVAFALVQTVADDIEGSLRLIGYNGFDLDALWPGVTDRPWVSFTLYLVFFDFVDYWFHRGQHRFNWWWQLHAVHHSQRDMTLWSDNRNHLLDDLLRDAVFALLAIAIGVPPGQFVWLVVATRAIQSVQHANVRWDFGGLGRVVVSPQFHRRHHAVEVGHPPAELSDGGKRYYGVNYAVLFPVWDMLFGTADFRRFDGACGIDDQQPGHSRRFPAGRDYGRGFLAQQWLAIARILGRA
ncbi:sterol desaturase family protein [Derxia gummosa]|uniref:Sterol desaturase family protein n=1 Tax=Derxia gummosa DSM 723 TaxID=1121388 RepID=A0A8B6X8J0_9BURK|nr:sterol desaturase family protein [Derxia gummosa]